MYFEKISGTRCYLSPIDLDDHMIYTEWVNDMEVASGMLFSSMLIGPESEKKALERLAETPYNFAIVRRDENRVIGNCGFVKLDHMNSIGEVGIFIGDRASRGMGYGQEALELLLDFGFNVINLHNISLTVYAFNGAAISCYGRIGFKEVGRLRESKQIAGAKYDTIIMDMLSSEFKSPFVHSVIERKMGE